MIVDLDRSYSPGEPVTVSVTYAGNPENLAGLEDHQPQFSGRSRSYPANAILDVVGVTEDWLEWCLEEGGDAVDSWPPVRVYLMGAVGEADARATEIYARAYNQSADSRRFYEFLKTMESYGDTFDKETWMVLSTGGDFYRFLVEGQGMANPYANQK